MEDDDLLTVDEVAKRLKMDATYVYAAIHRKKLLATKHGNRWRIRA